MGNAFKWIVDHKAEVLAGIVALDNLIAEIPSIEANSTFQLMKGAVQKLYDQVTGK